MARFFFKRQKKKTFWFLGPQDQGTEVHRHQDVKEKVCACPFLGSTARKEALCQSAICRAERDFRKTERFFCRHVGILPPNRGIKIVKNDGGSSKSRGWNPGVKDCQFYRKKRSRKTFSVPKEFFKPGDERKKKKRKQGHWNPRKAERANSRFGCSEKRAAQRNEKGGGSYTKRGGRRKEKTPCARGLT